MTTERFNEVVKEQLERIEKLLIKKQAEYNLDADRLSVFKHGASMSKETPEQVLYGFLLKHLISQADMISTGEKYTKELWLEEGPLLPFAQETANNDKILIYERNC